ncbi:MAG: OmpA family protein [Myxococcales bacterium]|nr:OmpA family protein [Myxococcales bacterium]
MVAAPPPAPENRDRDGDGIDNASDRCPDLPEDCDQFEDNDGCPELDNDHDLMLDACDKCPGLAEDWNGYQDDDGCPDRKVIIIGESLRIIQLVHFRHGSARVMDVSLPIIDEAAKVLVASPQLELVAIVGHAAVGEPNALELSRKRAEVVRDLLVQRGVAPERLEVLAEADLEPLAPNDNELNRAKNRRVEFRIQRTTPPPPEPPPAAYQPERTGCPGGEVPAPYTVRPCK